MEKKSYGTFSNVKSALKTKKLNDEVIIDMQNETFPSHDILEELIIRFPQLLQDILSKVNIQSLITCLKISRKLYNFIDNDRFPWIKKIQQARKVYPQLNSKQWNKVLRGKVLRNIPIKVFIEILSLIKLFFENIGNQWSPLHLAVKTGQLDLCKFIMEKTNNQNPKNITGITPFHLAAQIGHLEISKLLIENIKDKSPKDKNRDSPLHYAAKNGHFDVCKLIFEEIADKNPRNLNRDTPLHFAAQNGHEHVCQLILEATVEKSTECIWMDSSSFCCSK